MQLNVDIGIPIFGVVVVAFIALAIYSQYMAAKRRKELEAWAAGRGLSFSQERDSGFRERFSNFKCLNQGDENRYAYNIMTGNLAGREALCFDYHYTTVSHDSKGRRNESSHRFSAVIIYPSVTLRPLTIRPENILDKVAGFFGAEDIDFESAEFSRKFCVKSPDRKWAYDVLHPGAMEFLMAMPQFHIQMDERQVIAWRDECFDTANFENAAQTIGGLLDRMPDYLVKQQMESVQ